MPRLLCWFSILIFAVSGFASGIKSEEKAFADAVRKYVQMQQALESSVHAQRPTNESDQISDRQHQLTGLVANARRDGRQGEIFTKDVAKHFRKIIRKAFREPGGRAMRETIRHRDQPDPVKPLVLKVNDVYTDDQPRATMPPTLLNRLPALPNELAYRIIGHALVLQGTKTNLIVDFIPNVIP